VLWNGIFAIRICKVYDFCAATTHCLVPVGTLLASRARGKGRKARESKGGTNSSATDLRPAWYAGLVGDKDRHGRNRVEGYAYRKRSRLRRGRENSEA
jgi:hypothetical protein